MTTKTVFWGDKIALHYQLTSEDGSSIASSTFDEEPVVLTLGEGEIEARLESCLIDLEVGRSYTFKLEPDAAFGYADPLQIMDVPLDAFDEDEIEIGNLIAFTLPEGETLAGQIKAIGKDVATVDFNHPLSGCTVLFEVRIVEIL
jgi:FKBP-type peptidyl-prolyl cis-trans isomerase SlpA